MMNKDQKTEYLFSAIGEIDDRLLEEAVSYRRPARRKKYWIPVLAACLAVFFAISSTLTLAVAASAFGIAATTPLGLLILASLGSEAPSESPQQPEQTPEQTPERYASLDDLFEDQKKNDLVYLSADKLEYYEGASIIWQYEEGGEYCVAPLTDYELAAIKARMGRGRDVGESSPENTCRVWICDGKGNVRSPYLKNEIGNQDVKVFDYEAEIIPDEDFVQCISDILN